MLILYFIIGLFIYSNLSTITGYFGILQKHFTLFETRSHFLALSLEKYQLLLGQYKGYRYFG